MPLSESELRGLIDRITAGEADLFSQLLDEYNRSIFQFIWRQVKDETLAADLTHETFIKAFKNLRQFRGDSDFIYWLRRIALNCIRTFFTSKRGREMRVWESMDLHSNLSDEQRSPEQQAGDRELLRKMRKELNEIDKKQAEVIRLSIFNDQPAAEVARLLDIPEGTVLSRLNRGLKALLKRLAQGERDE